MANKALDWHHGNGGFLRPETPGPHGLRLLRETVELALALGAFKHEILKSVCDELARQPEVKVPYRPNMNEIGEELADTGMLHDVIAGHLGIDIEAEKDKKLVTLNERDWEADRYGVLWRPGRVPNKLYGNRAELHIVDDLEHDEAGDGR